ncbi:hypothetical protein D3C72_1603630 [compost metagenome]
MHGVGTEQNAIRARTLQPEGRLCEDFARFIPLTAGLAGLYLMEIDAVQQQARRMQAAETLFDAFINQAIIRNGGLPAHSSQQTDRFHMFSCSDFSSEANL